MEVIDDGTSVEGQQDQQESQGVRNQKDGKEAQQGHYFEIK